MTRFTPNPNPPAAPMGWFDRQFTEIGWPMLIALMVLFALPMWIFCGIGLLVTKLPEAKRKAKIAFIIISSYLACAVITIFILVHTLN